MSSSVATKNKMLRVRVQPNEYRARGRACEGGGGDENL